MAKKDTATAVLGMLSTTGSQTRPTNGERNGTGPVSGGESAGPDRVAEPVVSAPPPAPESAAVVASAAVAGEAPRTMRLRPETAASLRSAWLQAKRDDVLLTAQDFASDLVEHALGLRARTARRSTAPAPVG